MAVSAKWYLPGLDHLNNKDIGWVADTIKCALVTSSYTPNSDTHEFWATSVSANEISGTGYTAGGIALANKVKTKDTTNHREGLFADNVSWTTSTLTARYAIIYKTGTAGTGDFLMGYIDFGANVSTTAGTLQITWDATGVLRIDVV